MNVLVTMMESADGGKSRGVIGLRHDACHHIFKMVKSTDVQTVWHCFAKVLEDDDAHNTLDEITVMKNLVTNPTKKSTTPTTATATTKKRKSIINYSNENDNTHSEDYQAKKT